MGKIRHITTIKESAGDWEFGQDGIVRAKSIWEVYCWVFVPVLLRKFVSVAYVAYWSDASNSRSHGIVEFGKDRPT
jgi:hypothetical protein